MNTSNMLKNGNKDLSATEVMTHDVLKFQRQKPDWEEEKEFRARICNALLDAGLSAMEAADLLLLAVYDLHRHAQGAEEGWQERADRSFQEAVAAFCVSYANYHEIEIEPGCIRLPFP
jgi:hypothetical protein